MTNRKLLDLLSRFPNISYYHVRKLVALGFLISSKKPERRRGRPSYSYSLSQQAKDYMDAYRTG